MTAFTMGYELLQGRVLCDVYLSSNSLKPCRCLQRTCIAYVTQALYRNGCPVMQMTLYVFLPRTSELGGHWQKAESAQPECELQPESRT